MSGSWMPFSEDCGSSEHQKELQFAKDWVNKNFAVEKHHITYCIKENSGGIAISFIPGTVSEDGNVDFILNEGGTLLFDPNGYFFRFVSGI